MLLSGLVLTRHVRSNGFREKCGWYLFFAAFLTLFLFSTKPISNTLVYYLEHNYHLPSKRVLSNLDIMVILSGGVSRYNRLDDSVEASGTTYSRLFNGVRIFKENNIKLLVLSGTGTEAYPESDAVVMARLTEQLGVSKERIVIEGRSRNTLEHALNLKKILHITKGQKIGIVTSAIHMRRSEMVFKKELPENTIVPIPVNYIYSLAKFDLENFVPSSESFATSSYAIHELIGMLWYLIKY
jgi:uncharacterized SAM-binding protein YcdF (DUF218 family)